MYLHCLDLHPGRQMQPSGGSLVAAAIFQRLASFNVISAIPRYSGAASNRDQFREPRLAATSFGGGFDALA